MNNVSGGRIEIGLPVAGGERGQWVKTHDSFPLKQNKIIELSGSLKDPGIAMDTTFVGLWL